MPSWLTRYFSSESDSEAEKGKFYYGWVVLAACLVISITNAGIRFSFGVFFKSLEEDFGWTRAVTSGVFSVTALLSCIFAIIGGWVLDRYGSRVIFTIMGCFTAVGMLLTSQARTLTHFYLSYSLLLAIGTGPGYITIASTVQRWFIKRRGLAIGIATSGIGLGTIIMTPLATQLIASYGWRASYLIMSLIVLCFVVPSAQLLRQAPSVTTTLPEGKKLKLGKRSTHDGQSHYEPRDYSLLQAAKTRSLWLFISIWFFYSSCLLTVMAHIVRHGIDLGFTPMQAGSILTVIGGANVVGRLTMGRVSDSIGRKQASLICALLLAGAMLWLTQASSLWTLYLFAIIFGFAYGGISPPIGALIGETFGLKNLGTIMGIIEIGWASGAAMGPAMAGYMFDITGSYNYAFLGGMVFMLMAAVLIRFLKVPTS
ncbi:MFS transporter [Chloroflexota bacterium]